MEIKALSLSYPVKFRQYKILYDCFFKQMTLSKYNFRQQTRQQQATRTQQQRPRQQQQQRPVQQQQQQVQRNRVRQTQAQQPQVLNNIRLVYIV